MNRLIRADGQGAAGADADAVSESEGGGPRREGVYIFDLHKEIPYHSMEEEERKEIWDDGLHFTEKGYRRMGAKVAARLMEIIRGEKSGPSGGREDGVAE